MMNVTLKTTISLESHTYDKIYYALAEIQGLKFNPGSWEFSKLAQK